MGKTVVHIVWSPSTGPIRVYADAITALMHARTMLGVDLVTLAVEDELPVEALEDIAVELDGAFDEETPVTHVDEFAETPPKK